MENNSNSMKVITGILAVLFIATAVYSFSLYSSKKETERALTAEKELVIEELESLKSDYEKAMLASEEMSKELMDARSEIASYIDSVRSMKATIATISRYKRQIYQLKKDREVLMARVDSLTQVNASLASLNSEQSAALQKMAQLNDSIVQINLVLEQENRIASQLKLSSIALSGVKEKRNGTLKNVKRARATDQLEVCFTVTENEIAKASDRNFYIEVLDPQGDVVGSGDKYMNEITNRSVAISKVTNFYYENSQLDVCDFVESKSGEFEKGTYMVNVYDSELELIGSSKYLLK